MWTTRAQTQDVATALVAAVVAAVALAPVLSHPGWPFNHELLSFVTRMSAVAGQWRLGHIIPVWSTAQQWGYGSPAPALYHKAFLAVFAGFTLATGAAKPALCLAIGLFMVIAFCGAAACVRRALGQRAPGAERTAGAVAVLCNYATTDWFVRGAFAEFAGLAMASWVFAWCITLVVEGRWALWIGPIMAGLLLSHVVIGVFSLLPLGCALAIAIVFWPRRALRWLRPAALSVAVCTALVLPFELPATIFSLWARLDAAQIDGYTPSSNHLAFGRLFWDTAWHWGERWDGMTIQLDLVPLVALLVVAALAAGRRAGRGRAAIFLTSVAALAIALQTRAAAAVFHAVPGAEFIQFSWRLLTFISIALAVGAGLLVAEIRRLAPARWAPAASLAAALVMVASTAPNKAWWSGLDYGWYAPADIAAALHGDVLAAGEYLPRSTAPTVPAPTGDVRMPVFPAGACTVNPPRGPAGEQATARFDIICAAPGPIALPVFAAPGMAVFADPAMAVDRPANRTCDDPRLRVEAPAGESTVTVSFPTWTALMAAMLRERVWSYARACG